MKKVLVKIIANRFTPCINLVIAFLAWYANKITQVFCQPVLWASIITILFIISLSFYSYLKKNIITQLISILLQGTGTLISVYCIVFFTTDDGPIAAIFLCMLLLPLAPVYFLVQCIMNLKHEKNKWIRVAFFSGIFIPLIIQGAFVFQYLEFNKVSSQFINSTETLKELSNKITHSYISERIIGMHFKYHTRIDFNDGWRPPLHDPALNVCRWVTGIEDPLGQMELEGRIALYKMTYPELNVRENCSCADSPDGNSYISDPRLK